MKTLRICFGLLVISGTSWAQYLISTVAGGAPPPTPVPGLMASIGRAYGMATDSAGNAYFTTLNCVFKLDLNGVVTRIAGTSRLGFSGDGGAATLAQLNNPNGLAVDSAGNVYVVDFGNGRVRKISNGIITTVAGNGVFGTAGNGGPATNAQLQYPNGVAVDSSNNLFIADNNVVRKVAANGIISTVAGNGTGGFSGDGEAAAYAELQGVQYVAVDGSGNLFIADTGNNRIRKVSANGIITTLAGTGTAGYSGDGGPAANAQLQTPQGVAVDGAGNVYIADGNNNRVRKVSSAGIITTVVGAGTGPGNGDGGPAASGQINGPLGVALDAAGDLFIAEYYGSRIREVSKGIINTVAGTGAQFSGDNGAAPSAQLASPGGIAVDASGNLFIDDGTARLRKVAANGIITTVAGNGICCQGGTTGGVPATSTSVNDGRVAVDGSGNLYITDFFSAVRKVSTNGIITTIAGNGTTGFAGDGGPATSAELGLSPNGVAVDTSGNVFIADTGNNRIRKVSTTGIITTLAGNGTAGLAGDGGPATAAELSYPLGVAVDASGNVYIADTNNNSIRKVSPGGIITTLAGNGTGGFSGDGGLAASAQLNRPGGVAVDTHGNIFIADTDNSRVREVSSSGIITTVAGNGAGGFVGGYSGDCGPAASAQLSLPGDVAVDSSGNVYILDTDNNAVRRLQPTSKPTLVCAVADAASEGLGPVSPGKIVVIYGTGLGSSPISYTAPANGIFGTQLAGTSVSVNGVAAPLIYTLPGQVSAIVPYETTGSTAQFAISYQGQTSTFAVPVAAVAPSLFTANSSGIGQAAAINNVDGSYNSASDPVSIGGYIQLYATGEGQTSPAGVDGAVAALTPPFPAPIPAVQATVGGLPAVVEYAGAAPGSVAGLMQVNVQIPAGVQPGSQVPVVVQVGTASTCPGVTIAVAGN